MTAPAVPPSTPPAAAGTISRPSAHSVPETVARLEAAVAARGMTLFARIDHAAGAASVGLAMHDAQLLIVGNPRTGTPVMVAAPLAALDLPLRALVWRDPAGGQVWVSYTSPAYLAERYGIPAPLVGNLAGIAALVEAATEDRAPDAT